MPTNKDSYLSNRMLKKTNVNVSMTKNQLAEYMKCSEDPTYFIMNYIYIINVDKGKIKFDLWNFQQEMVNHFIDNRFTICKLPRQSGKSTTVAALMVWLVLFHQDYSIAILANKAKQAREILSRVQMAYENVPKWMQQGVVEWNKSNFTLENGSKIMSSATSPSAVRGGSFNLIYLDEFAHVDAFIQEEFFASVYPTISSGFTTKVIITSTPLGLNLFYKLWVEAVAKKNRFAPFSIVWSDIPGRDAAWEAQERANMTEEKFRQEYGTEFIGSSHTLISSKALQNLPVTNPVEISGDLSVYEMPIRGKNYSTVVDTSRGISGDYSAFTIIDITQIPYQVVARYRNNTIDPLTFPSIVYEVSMRYNEAYILVETNDIGQQVANILHNELEYSNIFVTAMKGRSGQMLSGGHVPGAGLGVRTTKQVKRIGCANLKTIIEGQKLIINDSDIREELYRFVQIGESYQAEPGWHDDLVMTLVLFAWVITQDLFKDLTDTNMRSQLQSEAKAALDDGMLFFAIDDRNEDVTEMQTVTQSAFDRWFYED